MEAPVLYPYLILDSHDWDLCRLDLTGGLSDCSPPRIVVLDLRLTPADLLSKVLVQLNKIPGVLPVILLFDRDLPEDAQKYVASAPKSPRQLTFFKPLDGYTVPPINVCVLTNVCILTLDRLAALPLGPESAWGVPEGDDLTSGRPRLLLLRRPDGLSVTVPMAQIMVLQQMHAARMLRHALERLYCILTHPEYHLSTLGAHTEKQYRVAPIIQEQKLLRLLGFHIARHVQPWNINTILTWANTGEKLARAVSAELLPEVTVHKIEHDVLACPVPIRGENISDIRDKRVLILQDVICTGRQTITFGQMVKQLGGKVAGVVSLISYREGYYRRDFGWKERLERKLGTPADRVYAFHEVDDEVYPPDPSQCKLCGQGSIALPPKRFTEIASPQSDKQLRVVSTPKDQFLRALSVLVKHGAIGNPEPVDRYDSAAEETKAIPSYEPMGISNFHSHYSYLQTKKLAKSKEAVQEIVEQVCHLLKLNQVEFDCIMPTPNELSEAIADALGAIYRGQCKAVLRVHWAEDKGSFEFRGRDAIPPNSRVLILDAAATSGNTLLAMAQLALPAHSVDVLVVFNRMKEGGYNRLKQFLRGGNSKFLFVCPIYAEWHDPSNCYVRVYRNRLTILLGMRNLFEKTFQGVLQDASASLEAYPVPLFPPRVREFPSHLGIGAVEGLSVWDFISLYKDVERSHSVSEDEFWRGFYKVFCGDAAAKLGPDFIYLLQQNPADVPEGLASGVLRNLSINQISRHLSPLKSIAASAPAAIALEALLALGDFSLTVMEPALGCVIEKIAGLKNPIERKRLYGRLVLGIYEAIREPQSLAWLEKHVMRLASTELTKELANDIRSLQQVLERSNEMIGKVNLWTYEWTTQTWSLQIEDAAKKPDLIRTYCAEGALIFDEVDKKVYAGAQVFRGKMEMGILHCLLPEQESQDKAPRRVNVTILREKFPDQQPANIRNNFEHLLGKVRGTPKSSSGDSKPTSGSPPSPLDVHSTRSESGKVKANSLFVVPGAKLVMITPVQRNTPFWGKQHTLPRL